MYFLIDDGEDRITVHPSKGAAARVALSQLGMRAGTGVNPVSVLKDLEDKGQRFRLLTLSMVIELITDLQEKESRGELSQLLINLKSSVDDFYKLSK